jgi:hypothetical protein
MKTPIIEGLTQGKLDSYLKERQYAALYWPTLFPLKTVNSLDAKTLIGDVGSRIAASVISYNAEAPENKRKDINTQRFDIPKVAVKRTKDEKQILDHAITRAIQGNDAVIEDYFNDADYVYDACNGRMEEMALSFLSKTTYQFTTTNNPQGIVNETVIDSGMPAANKKAASVVWSVANAASMKPLTDFKAVVKAARALGISFSKALMNPDTYDLITGSTEFQTAAKSLLVGESQLLGLMSLDVSNKILKALRLPEIALIETSVGIEAKDGTVTYANPWDVNHVLFVPETTMGSMYNGPIAEELEKPLDVLQSKKGNVLISVKKEFDPVSVTTKGECNVFPSWVNVDRCFSLYIADTTWA